MKYLLVSLISVGVHAVSLAQVPKITIYAFSRETSPGIMPNSGNEPVTQEPVHLPKTYYIYAEIKKGLSINASMALIEGHYYKVSIKKIKTPVVKNKFGEGMNTVQKDTLVKKSSNDVYEIKPMDECMNFPDKNYAEKMRNGNTVMLMVSYGKTKIYPGAAVIKTLAPAQGM